LLLADAADLDRDIRVQLAERGDRPLGLQIGLARHWNATMTQWL
jgi:hypothetical protein